MSRVARSRRSAKVTTRTGDAGYTGLLGPERVPKHHPRVEAFGEVDEATSALGLARASVSEPGLKQAILEAQRGLYVLMGELAAPPEVAAGLSRRISEADVRRLEEIEEQLLGQVEIAPEFVIPGNTFASATLDLARAVVRRAERRIARLAHDQLVGNAEILRYANRLSDLLFVMARYVERREGRDSQDRQDDKG